MRKKTLRTKVMCALLSLVFLASILNVQLPVEAKGGTATIPVTIGGKTYNVTPGQNVTVNTPGGTTTYNVRFVDGKPVALDMTQYTSLIFGEATPANGTSGSSSAAQTSGSASGNAAQSGVSASQSSTPAASTSNSNGTMSWNEFQKANAGKGMSSSEMSQAYQNYKAGNTGSSSSSSSSSVSQSSGSSSPAPQASVAEGAPTSSSGATQGATVSESASQGNSNWNPAKHPRDPQTGKFISHEEAIARGLMDPADASTTNSSSSQTAQSGEATQTTSGSSETAQASTDTTQASTETTQSGNGGESGTAAQAAQTSTEASQVAEGKTKTTIGDKFKAGYAKGKELTNAGVQNVKDSLKSGFSAKNILVTAGITVGVDLATQVMRGENPSLKSALQTVCCAEFVGGVTGSVLGSAAGSFFVPFLSCIPVVGGALSALAPTFGSVVGSSVGAYMAGDLKNGRFSIKEAFKRIDWVGVTGQTIGSTVGAALGSCLGPVGTILGGMAGGYLGNWAAHKIAGLFGKGEANLPTIAMPTGSEGGSVTTAGTITLGGDDVTNVTISDPVVINTNDDDDNNNNSHIDVSSVADLETAYKEYTYWYEIYSQAIQSGEQEKAIEAGQKMNAYKAKYDELRYGNND